MSGAGNDMLVPAPDARSTRHAAGLQCHGFVAGMDQQHLRLAAREGGHHAPLGRGRHGGDRHGQGLAGLFGHARPHAAQHQPAHGRHLYAGGRSRFWLGRQCRIADKAQ
ncbi:hypothetical protein SDC9_198391 [bioreactor metagenome]|uniref:Uncharacterized protein n=1 Tax=bioreactor metagenome TaxID=1076179 RepID=A0A645IHI9_9ZZZZ